MGNKSAKLPKDDLDFLLQRTSFTEKQIIRWHKGFTKDCPSGELGRSQFLEVYKELFPDGRSAAFYEHVFRTFDTDGSGQIDFKEFLLAISITQDGRPEEKLELAFRLYDIDRNGSIEMDEMTEIIKAIFLMTDQDPNTMGSLPLHRTRDIFEKMDLNKDGVLSKDEFINGCMNDETLFKLLTCSGVDT